MQLSEKGSVDLDAPVQRYLPWFRVADSAYSAQITVRQLLNQTSGLPPSSPFDTPVTSVQQRVRDLATIHLHDAPGVSYAYANSNFETLGVLVEAASGQAYGDYMQQHVFAPLAMTHTFASKADAERGGLATGHQWWFGLNLPIDTYRADYVPDGYLASSVADMSHYLIAQLQGGVYGGNRLLSQSGVDQMHAGVAKADTGGTYAMGWVETSLNGVTVVSHDGDSLNTHSDMILVPALGWGVQLIINSDSIPVLLATPVEATAKGVISILMGSSAPTTPSPFAIYVALDLVVGALVTFQLWSLFRASRSTVRPVQGRVSTLRFLILPTAWRLIAATGAIGLIGALALQVGSSFQLMAGTDFGVSLLLIASLLIANALVRVIRRVGASRLVDEPAEGMTAQAAARLAALSRS